MTFIGSGSGNMTPAMIAKLDSLSVAIKNNLSAIAEPTVTDDATKGYGAGSTWIYSNTTYTCTDATMGNAKWVHPTDIYYFDSWSALVTVVAVDGTTYVGKYANVANANGAPSSGLTYTAPNTLSDTIVDGGSATFKILAQGSTFSLTCQTRTITNPVVTSVMLVSAVKPTVRGYYIFSVVPTGGLPNGVDLNDIAFYDGANWSCYQKYSIAMAVLVAGTTTNTQVTWRKFNGTWMSTADEYNPDGKEYQTGKLYNGKAIYRKCIEGTTESSLGSYSTVVTIPTTGITLIISGTILRATGTEVPIPALSANGGFITLSVSASGILKYEMVSDTGFCLRPYLAWVEYTKS